MAEPSERIATWDPALPPPRWASRVPGWAWIAAFAVALWIARAAGYLFVDRPGGLALVSPAAGIVLYALFVTRRRTWPWVLAIVLAVGVVGSLRFGRTLGEAIGFNVAHLLESVAAWWLVVRLGGRPTLRTLRGTLILAFAPALVVGVVSAASHVALGASHTAFAEQRFWIFWAGSSLGILIVNSLLVEWTEPAVPLREAAGWVVSVAGIALSLLGGLALLRIPALPIDEVVLLPPLLWAAVRFGARGASLGIALGASAFVAVGQWEPLAQVSPSLVHGTVGTQLFVGVGAVSLLAVAAVVEERWAAQERRVLLERAMDHSPDPAGILDLEGRFVWANAATARLLGTSRAALLGRHAHALAGGSAADWRALWQKVVATGSVVTEETVARPGAPPAPFEVSAALVDAEGQQLLVSVFRDLTDRRRAEEASRLAALGTLAAGVAHEINNPLSYVVSNLAHVKDRLATLPDPDGTLRAEVLEPLAEAEEGARRVRDIVRQLRAFARDDEAAGPVDPGRALRAALAMAQSELRHRARVSADLAATAPVLASENRLTQVFVNLLVNAAQAIPEGASDRNEVRVALFPRGGEVVAEIADTGAGMPAETRARIFEPFFTTKAPGGGSGLGLAISHSIVTKLGGRIEVASTPGEGSVFRVILPAAPGARASGEPPGLASS